MQKARWLLIVVTVLVLLAVLSGSILSAQDNKLEANKAVLAAFFEAEAARDYDHMDDYFAEDFARHSVATDAVMPEFQVDSLEEYKQFLHATAAMFPDYYNTLDIVTAEGDYVGFCTTFRGSFVQNNNKLEIPIVGFVRFEGDKIAEMWIEWDNLTWNTQMGMVTPEQQNMALAQRALEDLWGGQGTLTSKHLEEYLSSSIVVHSPFEEDMLSDFPGSLAFLSAVRRALPERTVTILQQFAQADIVATHFTLSGVMANSFGSYRPSGKEETWNIVLIQRYEDGKSVEAWLYLIAPYLYQAFYGG